MPERPWTIASQVDATSRPTGVSAPMPVTTTRRCDILPRGSITLVFLYHSPLT